MRNIRSFLNRWASAALAAILLTVTTEAMAPPGGGGPGGFGGAPGGFGSPGGFGHRSGRRSRHNRIGPASGGSFTSKSTPRRDRRSAPKHITRPSATASQSRNSSSAPLDKTQLKRQEIKKSYADQRAKVRNKYANERQRIRERYATQRQQARDSYANLRRQIPEVRDEQLPLEGADPPEGSGTAHEDLREARKDAREEIRNEHWDHWHDHDDLGTVYTEYDFNDDDCEASIVVDGITYYSCDGAWYKRAYSGGTVTYVVVERPARD